MLKDAKKNKVFIFSLFGHTADENCVSLWSLYVTSEENTSDEHNNGLASDSHRHIVTGEEEKV